MFVKQIQVGQMAVFAYLLGDPITGDALVIDPAGDTREIIAEAKKNNLRINYIVNTHGHVDHIGGNAEMQKATGAKIVVHEDDAIMLTSTPATILRMFGAKPSPPADILVKDGDIISVGNVSLKVIHTPGHSPGGISLYSPGYVPGGSWQIMYKAIKEKLFSLPEDTKVMPGHNYGRTPTSTIGHEKNNNPSVR